MDTIQIISGGTALGSLFILILIGIGIQNEWFDEGMGCVLIPLGIFSVVSLLISFGIFIVASLAQAL